MPTKPDTAEQIIGLLRQAEVEASGLHIHREHSKYVEISKIL